MADFDAHYDDFKALGRTVVFLSTDAPSVSRALHLEMHLHLTLVCDPNKTTVQAWDLYNPTEHGGIAKPALYSIAVDGTLEMRRLGGIQNRVSAEATLRALD